MGIFITFKTHTLREPYQRSMEGLEHPMKKVSVPSFLR